MPNDKTDPGATEKDQAKKADPAPAGPGNEAPDPNARLGADLDALLAENADMRDRLLRTMADMENLRRRTEREKADTARYANTNFARDVLSVGDNLRRTIDHVPPSVFEVAPKLLRLYEAVKDHPGVRSWYARPAV